jgi:hypothetical protein
LIARESYCEGREVRQLVPGRGLRVDTRALQHYLGHRNIVHTVRYTELRSDRFDGFWKD